MGAQAGGLCYSLVAISFSCGRRSAGSAEGTERLGRGVPAHAEPRHRALVLEEGLRDSRTNFVRSEGTIELKEESK